MFLVFPFQGPASDLKTS